ncbi:MAG: lanthionine synthetase LanC family protein, partial [Longimicrobiales bacterium]
TLQWCSAAGDRAPASVLTRLEQLTELGSGRDNLRWPQKVPRHHRKPTSMPGWCNGSAGFVFLGTAAAEHLGAEWLTVAERAAMDAWSDSDGVPNLCCGLAGRGFALLHLYRVTGSRIWLDRAREVAGRAAERGELGAEGLYKGDAGLALLGSGIEDPDHAFMPLFELPRAGRG